MNYGEYFLSIIERARFCSVGVGSKGKACTIGPDAIRPGAIGMADDR